MPGGEKPPLSARSDLIIDAQPSPVKTERETIFFVIVPDFSPTAVEIFGRHPFRPGEGCRGGAFLVHFDKKSPPAPRENWGEWGPPLPSPGARPFSRRGFDA